MSLGRQQDRGGTCGTPWPAKASQPPLFSTSRRRPTSKARTTSPRYFRSTAEGETGHATATWSHGRSRRPGHRPADRPHRLQTEGRHRRRNSRIHRHVPGMARTARDEGFEEIADWFETLAKAEKSHAGRFQRALDTME